MLPLSQAGILSAVLGSLLPCWGHPAPPGVGPVACCHCTCNKCSMGSCPACPCPTPGPKKPPASFTFTQIPQPMHSSSEIHAIFELGLTSMQSLPVAQREHHFSL